MKLINVYACNFYGSCILNLQSKEVERPYTIWNVTVRQVFKLDRRTHRSLIEPLSEHLHLKTILFSRYLGFYKELVRSPKFTVRYLARLNEYDLRTVPGRTLHHLVESCGTWNGTWDQISSGKVKCMVKYAVDGEDWRSIMGKELMSARQKRYEVCGFSNEEIEELLKYICTE